MQSARVDQGIHKFNNYETLYCDEDRPINVKEIETTLSDLRKLTEGEIVRGVGGGG